MSYLLFRDVVDQAVTNTSAETTVGSFTIPANALTDRALLIEQTGKYAVNNIAGRLYTVRLKLNGSTISTLQTLSPGKTTQLVGNAQRWSLAGIGNATVRCIMTWASGGPGSATGTTTAVTGPGGGGTNVLSVDLTADVAVLVTVQMNTNGSGHTYTSTGIWGVLLTEPGEAAASAPATIVNIHRRTIRV